MAEQTIFIGDCREILADMAPDSIAAVVTDPPYHLTSIVKRFWSSTAAPAKSNGATGVYARASAGFMGCKWDAPDALPIDADFANWFAGFADGEGCFSVHKKQVNNCETYDCQFSITMRADDKPILVEIQQRLGGIGSLADRPARNGNPQARYCVSSQHDCALLREILTAFPLHAKKRRDFDAWSHALDCWLEHRQGEWEDMAYYRDALMAVKRYGSTFSTEQLWHYRWARAVLRVMKPGAHLLAFGGTRTWHRMACAIEDAGFEIRDTVAWMYGQGFPKSHNLDGDWQGWGTALKPAFEPIVLARKPLSERSVAANVLRWGTGALNIEVCRVGYEVDCRLLKGGSYGGNRNGAAGSSIFGTGGTEVTYTTVPPASGRWPANVTHDGSDEVLAAFPDAPGQIANAIATAPSAKFKSVYGKINREGEASAERRYTDNGSTNFAALPGQRRADTGSAARFFYCAKATAAERVANHPTVKPIKLMKWLVAMITPPGGTVLDPFCGTGSTLAAADDLGFDSIGIDIQQEAEEWCRARVRLQRELIAPSDNPIALENILR